MADPYDVISLEEARQFVKNVSTASDAQLEAWITAVSRRLDDLCGPIVQRTVTDELHQGPYGAIWLHETPVVSITNVKEWASGTATTLTAETAAVAGDYYYNSRLGSVTRRSSWYDTHWSSDYVTVTYVAGRAVNTVAVDPLFKQAAVIVLTHLWRSSGTGRGEVFDAIDGSNVFGTPPFAIPRAAIELLGSEVRAPAIA